MKRKDVYGASTDMISRRAILTAMTGLGAAALATTLPPVSVQAEEPKDQLSEIVKEENARLRREVEAFDEAGVRKRAQYESGEYRGRVLLAGRLSGATVNYQAVNPERPLVAAAPNQILVGKIALDVSHEHRQNSAFPVVYTFNGKTGIATLRPEHRKLDPAQPRRYNVDLDEHSALVAPKEAGRYWLGIFGQAQSGEDLEDAAKYIFEGRAWTTKTHDTNSPFALTRVFGDEEAYFALRHGWLPKRQQGENGEELGLLAATAIRVVVDPKLAPGYKAPEEKGVVR